MKRGISADHSLSQPQIQRLLSYCQNLEEKVLVKLPLYEGLRCGEIAHLRVSWITSEGYLRIPREQPCQCVDCQRSKHKGYWQPKTKSGARILPIPQQLYPDLLAFLRQSPSGFNYSRVNVYHHIKAILRKAGLESAYPHSLRATCFTILASNNMTAPALAAFAGWSNIGVAQAYINMVQAQQAAISQASQIFGKL